MKNYIISLVRSITDFDKETALEKFEYELKNELYDKDNIEIREINI